MTCIVEPLIKTKKELKARAQGGAPIFIEDPSIVAPFAGDVRRHPAARSGVVVTNHPRRTWFARVTVDDSGSVTVS